MVGGSNKKETLRKRNREMGEKKDGELYGIMKEAVPKKQCCRAARDLVSTGDS